MQTLLQNSCCLLQMQLLNLLRTMLVLCRVHCFLPPTKARLRHIIIDTSPLACNIGVTTCFWRQPDPDCKGVFHRVVYNSISAQYPTQYANLAFPFSRLTCCSTVAPSMARSANPAAALLHHRWRATLFHPKATLRSSSRRGFLIEMIPHLIVLNIPMSIQTWLCLRLR